MPGDGNFSLFRGIFWIPEPENPLSDRTVLIRIPVDPEGNPKRNDTAFSSRRGDDFNHERSWASLSKSRKEGKPFDFFPRGRVEIGKRKAVIWLHPSLARNNCLAFLFDRFGLTKENGILSVRVIPDRSKHYRCFLDG